MHKTQLVLNIEQELEAIKSLDPNTPIADQLNLVSVTLKSVKELVEIAKEELRLAS